MRHATFQEIRATFVPSPDEPVRIIEGTRPKRWFADRNIGCISLLPLNRSKSRFRVGGWYVQPLYRGQGIGAGLLKAVATEEPDATLVMNTASSIPGRQGWRKTGRTFKYGAVEWERPGV